MLFTRKPAPSSHFGTLAPYIPIRCLVSSPSAPNPFRIRTSVKHTRNPFRIRTSKTQNLNFFRMNTYKKTREGVLTALGGTDFSLCSLLPIFSVPSATSVLKTNP